MDLMQVGRGADLRCEIDKCPLNVGIRCPMRAASGRGDKSG